MPVGARQFCVAGQKGGREGFGKRHISTIIGGERITKLPDARYESLVFVPFDEQIGQIVECLLCSRSGDFLSMYQASQNLGDFNIEQVRSVQAFRRLKGALDQLVRSIGA